jgi:hypothetical protein
LPWLELQRTSLSSALSARESWFPFGYQVMPERTEITPKARINVIDLDRFDNKDGGADPEAG